LLLDPQPATAPAASMQAAAIAAAAPLRNPVARIALSLSLVK
jgi:hypothetical protein